MKEENKLENKVAYWSVHVLDQGHYGFTQCSNCRYEPKEKDPYDSCVGCGYKMQGVKQDNISFGGSDY